MTVQAYILIQTEVGKAANVASQIAEHRGRHARRRRHRPVRRDRPRRGAQRRRARQAGRRPGAEHRGHHPHADLPGRPPLIRAQTRNGRDPVGLIVGAGAIALTRCAPSRSEVAVPEPGDGRRRHACSALVNALPEVARRRGPPRRRPYQSSPARGAIRRSCSGAESHDPLSTSRRRCSARTTVSTGCRSRPTKATSSTRPDGWPGSRSRCRRRTRPEVEPLDRSRRGRERPFRLRRLIRRHTALSRRPIRRAVLGRLAARRSKPRPAGPRPTPATAAAPAPYASNRSRRSRATVLSPTSVTARPRPAPSPTTPDADQHDKMIDFGVLRTSRRATPSVRDRMEASPSVTMPSHVPTTRNAARTSLGRCQPAASVADSRQGSRRGAEEGEPRRGAGPAPRAAVPRPTRRHSRVPARQGVERQGVDAEVRTVEHAELEHLGGDVRAGDQDDGGDGEINSSSRERDHGHCHDRDREADHRHETEHGERAVEQTAAADLGALQGGLVDALPAGRVERDSCDQREAEAAGQGDDRPGDRALAPAHRRPVGRCSASWSSRSTRAG